MQHSIRAAALTERQPRHLSTVYIQPEPLRSFSATQGNYQKSTLKQEPLHSQSATLGIYQQSTFNQSRCAHLAPPRAIINSQHSTRASALTERHPRHLSTVYIQPEPLRSFSATQGNYQ